MGWRTERKKQTKFPPKLQHFQPTVPAYVNIVQCNLLEKVKNLKVKVMYAYSCCTRAETEAMVGILGRPCSPGTPTDSVMMAISMQPIRDQGQHQRGHDLSAE